MGKNELLVRNIKLVLLSLFTALIPFLIFSYMWDGYKHVSVRVIIGILVVNTLPCVVINLLYHKYRLFKEWVSSFYFFITFLLTYVVILVIGLKLLFSGNYFDYYKGYIILFMLAETFSIFLYTTYIFIKFIKEKYDFTLLEKILFLISGFFGSSFIIGFTALTSSVIMYIFD